MDVLYVMPAENLNKNPPSALEMILGPSSGTHHGGDLAQSQQFERIVAIETFTLAPSEHSHQQ